MKIFLALTLLSTAFIATNGLRCFSCTNAKSNAECRRKVTCSWGALGCENEVRYQNNQLFISKHCQQYNACKASTRSNLRQCIPQTLLKAVRPSMVLDHPGATSMCRSCCNKELCNGKPYMEESVSKSTTTGINRHRVLLPPIADVESTLTTPTSALITFTDPSDTPGASYYITLYPSEGVTLTAIKNELEEIPGVRFNDSVPRNVIAYIASGLSGGTRYKVNIVKKVGFSRFAQGTFDSFVTPPKPLQGLKILEFKIDSVLVDVGKPTPYKNDKYDSIRLAYRKTSDPEEEEKVFPPSSSPGVVRISDLEPSTEYIISVWTSLDSPTGEPTKVSERVNVTVFTVVPPVVETILAKHHATNLTWEWKTSHKGLQRAQAEFVVTVRDDTDGVYMAQQVVGGSRRSFTAMKLVPEHYYTFTVKAETDGHSSVVVSHPPVRTVTRCYGCVDAKTKDECMEIIECMPDDRGCLVELRSRSVGKSLFAAKSFRATMTCKQVTACDKQEDQNLSMQCDPVGRTRNSDPPEVCRCCCEGDLCDGPGTDCGRLLGWLDPIRRDPPTTYAPVNICKELKPLRDGSISCTEGVGDLGTVCSFTCNAGSYLLGIGKTECLPGGDWTHRIPVCKPSQRCPAIETTGHMYAKCTSFNNPFSRCEMVCRPGYIAVGKSRITCKPTGQWTPTKFRCVERDECKPNPCINRATCNDFVNSFECECKPGYYGELCERERICEVLLAPDNGTVECTEGNAIGSRCRYSCSPGYSMHGVKYTRCDSMGLWSGGEPTICVVNTCEVFSQTLVNGGRSKCSGYSFGDTCKFSCPAGLKISGGPENITCMENSEWSSDPPCCDLPCPPYSKVDLLLILDSSSSVGRKNWGLLIDFTVALLDQFVIGKKDMRVGVMRFNRKVDTKNEIEIGDYLNANHLKAKIRKIPYNGYGTKTGIALQHAYDHSLKVPGNRPGIPDVIIVITDGLASDNVKIPAQALRAVGAKMYVVGVINKRDRVNVAQLEAIASGPQYLQIIDEGYEKLAETLSTKMIKDVCWLPCKFKYEQKELLDRHQQLESLRISEEEEEYWKLFDQKIKELNSTTTSAFTTVETVTKAPAKRVEGTTGKSGKKETPIRRNKELKGKKGKKGVPVKRGKGGKGKGRKSRIDDPTGKTGIKKSASGE